LDCRLDRDGCFVFANKASYVTIAGHMGDAEQSLAADGAIACFSSSFVSFG